MPLGRAASEGRRAWHWLPGLLLACLTAAQADVLVGTNGERFVGKVIEENADTVVFESELGGRLTLPRARIRELQRRPPTGASPAAPTTDQKAVFTNQLPTISSQIFTNTWRPPGIGHDGFDWIQLKSGEWLKGELKYVERKKVEFDSDELGLLTLKLKDIPELYPAEPMFTKFDGRAPAFGMVVLSNSMVFVQGPEQLGLPRDELTGMTPKGQLGTRYWSGNLSAGLSLQSGNTEQTTLTTRAELSRRTPNTRLGINYLGNYSEVNGSQNVNNQRVNSSYDIDLDRHWFVRPAQFEYYHDPIANISLRATASVGAGYRIFDLDDVEWWVGAGPGYQYTQFKTVESGQSDTASTMAGVLQTNFKADLTDRLTFIQAFTGMVVDREAGQYTHHSVSTLEFEIEPYLNLDVSFVWDYLHNPRAESSGVIPKKSDLYLTVGLGVKF